MAPKRRRSSASSNRSILTEARTIHRKDCFSALSSELLIRILHLLPINTLLQCQRVSHRLCTLAGDSQIWKNLYYNRFVLPRALRIPGIKTSHRDIREDALHFSSRASKWLDEDVLVNGKGGKTTNWKRQYKLRHNWSRGACQVQEIHLADRPSVPEMLVRLAEGVVVTADVENGLRAWYLKEKALISKFPFEGDVVPTCLAVDEQDANGLGIAVGFVDGGWGTWRLDVQNKAFAKAYSHPQSSNGTLSAVAYAYPYILTITDAQILSLYTFEPKLATNETSDLPLELETGGNPTSQPQPEEEDLKTETLQSRETSPNPTLLASLKSHTSWPPLSPSIRTTPTTLIASIAYSLPTYLSGYTIGLQELHLSLSSGLITFSRLASSLPQGFHSLLSSSSTPVSTSGTPGPVPDMSLNPGNTSGGIMGSNTSPTTLSYAHPYILATHPDNTLMLYLCTSSSITLSISPGTKLWGHTSSVSSAEITPRGKAVSVSTRGNELRVWELEGGFGSASRKRLKTRTELAPLERSVRVRPETRGNEQDGEEDGVASKDFADFGEEVEARKQWVGFDDEVVIVLKESARGTQALMVYNFA